MYTTTETVSSIFFPSHPKINLLENVFFELSEMTFLERFIPEIYKLKLSLYLHLGGRECICCLIRLILSYFFSPRWSDFITEE